MASTCNELNESGEHYHDQIVQYLFQKATLRNVKFELNLENTQAGKFTGCSLLLEESKKWYFVLASSGSNPPITLSEDVLFPVKDHARTNGEFSLFRFFRSYCDIEDYSDQAEGEKKFVLLTNNKLNHSEVSECTEMDEIFKMSDSSKFHTFNITNATLRQFATFTNREFEMVRKAIVALFTDGEMSQILKEYKTPLVPLFSLRYGKVKIAENFSEFNKDPRLRKLFNLLKEDFAKFETDIATVSVERTNMEDFWTISSRNLALPPVVDRATVKQFFDSLVIGSAQPGGQDLLEETNNEWRLWMLSWIKREDFELLTKHQLEQPWVSFKKAFEDVWESGTVAARGRKSLNLEDGMRFLKYVEFKLDYSLWNCTKKASEELSKIEQQFIHRRIVYNNQFFPPSRNQYLYLKDTKLVDQLYSTFNDEKVFVLEAEPGMGRTTLWRYLAFYAQKKYPDCAVFLIHLNKLLKTFGTDGTEMEDLFKCSDKRLNGGILKDDSRKKLLFLDGFDELSAQKTCSFENLGDVNRDKVIDIVETILERNNTKVFFNCRHIFTNMFELTFDVKAMQLEQFNGNEKIEFLSMLWNIPEQNKNRFEVFAKHVLSKLKKDIKQNLYKILELPLMLKMLGGWYSESIKKFLSEDKNIIEASGKLAEVNLFKHYVENSIKQAIHKGNNVEDNLNNFDITTENYQLLSVYKMVPEDLLRELIESNPDLIKSESEIMSEILINRNESNVLKVVDGILMFAHMAFASFLCARFFYENVEKIKISETMAEKFGEFFKNNTLLRVFFFSMVDSEPKEDLMLFVSKLGERSAFWACKGDCVNVVNYLKNLFNYNNIRTQFFGRSMLQVAVAYNSQKVLEVLLELEFIPLCFDSGNLLLSACQNGHFEIVQTLLWNRATLVIVERVANFFGIGDYLCDSRQNTILHYTAEHGSVEMVQYLIDRSARIDVENNLGETPLFLAVKNNHIAVAELLIKTGANISHKDHGSTFILHAAAKSGNVNLVKLILDYASNQNLDKAMLIECRNNAKTTPLHVAVQRDFQDVVAFLVSSKANVNATDNDGNSALHIASTHGHLELVRCLIEGNANPNLKNSSRQTPLYVAIENGHLDVVKFFKNVGQDIRRINSHKKSCLNAAVKSGNVELVKSLMRKIARKYLKFSLHTVPIQAPEILLPVKKKTDMSLTHLAPKLCSKRSVEKFVKDFYMFDVGQTLKKVVHRIENLHFLNHNLENMNVL